MWNVLGREINIIEEIKQIPKEQKETKEYTIKQLTEILGHDIKIISAN